VVWYSMIASSDDVVDDRRVRQGEREKERLTRLGIANKRGREEK
jgi:hypothetical protein